AQLPVDAGRDHVAVALEELGRGRTDRHTARVAGDGDADLGHEELPACVGRESPMLAMPTTVVAADNPSTLGCSVAGRPALFPAGVHPGLWVARCGSPNAPSGGPAADRHEDHRYAGG